MVFSILPLADALLRRSFIASGLRARSVDVDDDTTIHCWISAGLAPQNGNPNPKSGSKPVILLIHGFGPSAMWQWRAQVGALAGRFDLVVPDLIFFGGSSTRSSLRSEAYQAAALARLLDALGVRRLAAAAGTSYGGFVAYHLARDLGPARVARVVVASSDLLKTDDDDRAFLSRGAATGVAAERVEDLMLPGDVAKMRALMGLAFYRPPRFVPDFVLRDIIRSLYNDKLKEKMELIEELTVGKKNEFQLTPLEQEVLIIWGEHDQIFPVKKAFEVKRQLGEKAKLEVLKKTGHMPQMEDSKRFNQILLNFLLDAPAS